MARFVNVIAVAVVAGNLVKELKAQGTINEGDNAEQFALLCRIYNVAKNPPINHVDLKDPNKIVKEIDALNASLVDSKGLNETDQVENSSGVQLKPTTREETVAQAIISRITQKAHDILREIRKNNVTEEIEKVEKDFHKVIFGESGNEYDLDHEALKNVGDRSNACGNSGLSGKGASAGNNLVVDFFCLCAQNTNTKEGTDNVCGFFVGRKNSKSDKHGWGDTGLLGSPAMWASIKKGCGNLMHQRPKSTEEGRDVLGDFLKHLKSGGVYRHDNKKDSDRKEGVLGTSVLKKGPGTGNGPVCDGRKGGRSGSPGGMCVYYGSEPQWEENIAWLKKSKTALNEVDAINNHTATIQRDIDKLQMLLHRAAQIYETTNVISKVQNPVLPTNLQTAAKRLTAYNAARSNQLHHFILLFVLL